MLSTNEKNLLLRSFPQVKLSYETMVHNKVYDANYVLCIPEGVKYFAWFKESDTCFFMELNNHHQIVQVEKVHIHTTVHAGAIFYGTLFYCKSRRFFSVEDLLFYKGKYCDVDSFDTKLNHLEMIFKENIAPCQQRQSPVLFGLPVISDNVEEINKYIPSLPYKVRYIQFIKNGTGTGNERTRCNMVHKVNIFKKPINQHQNQNQQYQNQQHLNKPAFKNVVFLVKPDIQNDIYHLYHEGEGEWDVAYIPDYKTSVMMNTHFRNIKENANLDALEESDDEDEFENNNIDKFVYLDRQMKMLCTYNPRFKKWAPIRMAASSEKIVTKNELIRLENNKY